MYKHFLSTSPPRGNLKQHRWPRLRKRHLKSEVTLPQTLYRLFHLVQFVKCWQFLLKLNSNRIQGKKKQVVAFCSRPPQNKKLDIFKLKSFSDGKEMYKKVSRLCRDVVCQSKAYSIGQFRVPPGLCIKTRIRAQHLMWK